MSKFQHVFFIIAFIFIVIPASCQGIVKLPEDQVNQVQTELAKNFAHNFFSTLKDGKTYEFHGEATEILSKSFTPESQKQVYQDIKSKFGDYKSLEYVETWKDTGNEKMTIIRFKGTFSKGTEMPEIRIVLDEANKIAGFWYKPWIEEFK
jgi:hypothetical protein